MVEFHQARYEKSTQLLAKKTLEENDLVAVDWAEFSEVFDGFQHPEKTETPMAMIRQYFAEKAGGEDQPITLGHLHVIIEENKDWIAQNPINYDQENYQKSGTYRESMYRESVDQLLRYLKRGIKGRVRKQAQDYLDSLEHDGLLPH